MLAPRARSNEPQTALTYNCAAFTHYCQLFPLAVSVALATFNVGLALAAAPLGVLVLIGVLPWGPGSERPMSANHEARPPPASTVANCTIERRAGERDSGCSWGDRSASSDGFGASAGD